jgi:hypothetical protein
MNITPKIYATDEFCYIKLDEVPVELKDALIKFMYGQTMPYIEGVYAIYSWDYENFINKLLGRPHFFD